MSKASEWANALAALTRQVDEFGATKPSPFRLVLDSPHRWVDFQVEDNGEPRIVVVTPRVETNDAHPGLDEIRKLARWILDTFGEPDTA